MEMVCPLCNGLAAPAYQCPTCGYMMEDQGTLDEFRGPYAPYEENSLLSGVEGACVHLFNCPACGRDKRLNIPQILI